LFISVLVVVDVSLGLELAIDPDG